MAATVTCPDGHQSEATDWCDTCGTAIGGDPSPAAETAAAAPSSISSPATAVPAGDCPNCGTAHHEDEAFCEVCGLDFATGQLPQVAPPVAVEASPDPAGAEAEGPTWTVTVDVDRAWFDHNEAESGAVVEYPADAKPRTVELTGSIVTVGRRDDKRGWYPTIDLGVPVLDPSTSRQHAELRAKDDGWQLVDLDSTNGTTLDGNRIVAGAEHDLADGSVIHVGAFTRITVHAPEAAEPEATA